MNPWRAAVLCLAITAGCDRPISTIREIPSPDGERVAVVFTSHGSAVPSDLHTSVSILPADRPEPRWPPNTFTALHRDEGSPEGPFFGPAITVRWLSPRTLEIVYDERAYTLRRHEEVNGVTVVYRTAPQEHQPSRGLPSEPADDAAGPQTAPGRLP